MEENYHFREVMKISYIYSQRTLVRITIFVAKDFAVKSKWVHCSVHVCYYSFFYF